MEKPNESFAVSYEFQHRVNTRKEALSDLEKESSIYVRLDIRTARLRTRFRSR
ncbi:MAG: hypothetical protein ACLRL6_16195 [Clostridium sp.]